MLGVRIGVSLQVCWGSNGGEDLRVERIELACKDIARLVGLHSVELWKPLFAKYPDCGGKQRIWDFVPLRET